MAARFRKIVSVDGCVSAVSASLSLVKVAVVLAGPGQGWLAGWLARAALPDHDFTEVTPGTPRPPHINRPESETRESRVTWPADYGSTL